MVPIFGTKKDYERSKFASSGRRPWGVYIKRRGVRGKVSTGPRLPHGSVLLSAVSALLVKPGEFRCGLQVFVRRVQHDVHVSVFGIEAGIRGIALLFRFFVSRVSAALLCRINCSKFQGIERNSDVLFADSEEAADAYDCSHHVTLLIDDHVVDLAEIVTITVFNGAADQRLGSPVRAGLAREIVDIALARRLFGVFTRGSRGLVVTHRSVVGLLAILGLRCLVDGRFQILNFLEMLFQRRECIAGPLLQIVVFTGSDIALEQSDSLPVSVDLYLDIFSVEPIVGEALQFVQIDLMLVVELARKLDLDVLVIDEFL